MKKILVMGLPGAGKTYLAQYILQTLESEKKKVRWLNADSVRQKYSDWDFSHEGRIRQSIRMRELAEGYTDADFVICDFVAPLAEMRHNFKADWIVWVDTVDSCQYEDTNKLFVPPEYYDFRVTEKHAEKWGEFIAAHLIDNRRRPTFDWRSESTLMLGRYQPWHQGHRALFERALMKTGQVIIQVRDCQGWNDSNPFDFEKVKGFIRRDLDPLYQGRYEIMLVPNITEIVYGRDVGYKITQETFSEEIHSISATKIRQSLGLK